MINRIKIKAGRIILPVFLIALLASCGSNSKNTYQKGSDPVTPKKMYTLEEPGEWEDIAEEHIPVVTYTTGFGHDVIVRVNLVDEDPDHYIEKIGILDKDGNEVAYEIFSPHAKYFEAKFFSHKLPVPLSDLRAYAKCSLHDLWVADFPED